MLRPERVASVYAAPPRLRAAGQLAAQLGVPARSVAVDTADLAPGSGALVDLADRHRGETVVVVTDVGGSAGVAGARVVLVDGDGWSVRSWPQNSRAPGSSTPRSAS